MARYTLAGSDGSSWRTLATGTTIGYRKLDRFAPADLVRVRLEIEDAVARPRPVSLALYSGT